MRRTKPDHIGFSIVRTLTALKRAGLLRRARGTLLRRATDPWESLLGGMMNTLVPEPEIASHQGPDAQSGVPELDVVTMAVEVPETLAHLNEATALLAAALFRRYPHPTGRPTEGENAPEQSRNAECWEVLLGPETWPELDRRGGYLS